MAWLKDEGNITAPVSEVPAMDIDQIKWETHINFNDLQYIIKGEVKMGIAPISNAKVTKAYDSKSDAANYDDEGDNYFTEPVPFFFLLRRMYIALILRLLGMMW